MLIARYASTQDSRTAVDARVSARAVDASRLRASWSNDLMPCTATFAIKHGPRPEEPPT